MEFESASRMHASSGSWISFLCFPDVVAENPVSHSYVHANGIKSVKDFALYE
jgi:hypothetical protein